MNDHSVLTRAVSIPVPSSDQVRETLQSQQRALILSQPLRRGRPRHLSLVHVCLGVLFALFEHLQSQYDLWRVLISEPIAGFAPVQICDQTLYYALARASDTMRGFFEQMSQQARLHLAPWQQRHLAPFAHQVVALDECVLDKIGRYLPPLRQTATGSKASILAGRISALFDIRLQQWVRVDLLQGAKTNCKVHARAMLEQLAPGTLVLFDRGYFAFSWFDTLTSKGLFWISRYSKNTSYQIKHICYQGDGVLDAIVNLGKHRSDQAGHPVRLLRFVYRNQEFAYLTNVCDPLLLPLADVVRLYARRWDIEMGFRVLKDYLNLQLIWSAKWSVIQLQLFACLLLAQLFHGLQQELACKEGVDPEDLSRELLIRLLPRMMRQGPDGIARLMRYGREWGLIRRSGRIKIEAPLIDPSWIIPPPEEILHPQEKVRHAHRKCHREVSAA
jgi:Transposase DDE domain